MRRALAFLSVAGLAAVAPGVAAAGCRTVDREFGRYNGVYDAYQYRFHSTARWCWSRGVVRYYRVVAYPTYTGFLFEYRGQRKAGWWTTWNGRRRGARVELRTLHFSGCFGPWGVGCVRHYHPWIRWQLRAGGSYVLAADPR